MRIRAALLVLLLAGCSTVYKPGELTRGKRYAVVSIMAGANIEAASKPGMGATLSGLHNGATKMERWGVDASGQRIWSGVSSACSKDSVAFIGDAVNFTTLHPLLLQSTDAAIASMLAKLDGGYR